MDIHQAAKTIKVVIDLSLLEVLMKATQQHMTKPITTTKYYELCDRDILAMTEFQYSELQELYRQLDIGA